MCLYSSKLFLPINKYTKQAITIIKATSILLSMIFTETPAKKEFYFGSEVVYCSLDELKAGSERNKNLLKPSHLCRARIHQSVTFLKMGCDYTYNSDAHSLYYIFVYWMEL